MSRQPSSSAPGPPPAMRPVARETADFLSPEREARAFWRLRGRLIATSLHLAFSRARFRLTLILVLSTVLWIGLFWLFRDGFEFLRTGIVDAETHDDLVRGIFGMFFAALTVMLVFSAGIILYGSLFRSRETAFLLTTPARPERVFLHKFQESILLSSWGFLLLGSPVLMAYGLVARTPWYYYAMLPPLMAAFVYIPTGLGAMACLLIVRYLPGRRFYLLWAAAGLLAVGACWLAWSLLTSPESDLLTPNWFREILARMKISEGRLLPSWWLSSGLLEAARRQWHESLLFLGVMIANALFCRQCAVWMAGRFYRSAYSGLSGRQTVRKRTRLAEFDQLTFRLTRFLPRQMQLLLVKDLRLFRRDPAQWSQLLVFLGLLALYFLNIRRFTVNIHYLSWVNVISFLNLSVVGLLMSTFTTRFIFPMISLEGRRFWFLTLLPVRRDAILWSKFLFATAGSILPCAGLILLSDLMLGMLRLAPIIVASHQLTCVILCVGLSGIAVGLGARLPSLREDSPARIAAGFGGTLNLVVSTLYIVAVVMLTAVPCHFHLLASRAGSARLLSQGATRWLAFWLIAGTIGSVVLGVLATVIPLRIGFRAFRRLES